MKINKHVVVTVAGSIESYKDNGKTVNDRSIIVQYTTVIITPDANIIKLPTIIFSRT